MCVVMLSTSLFAGCGGETTQAPPAAVEVAESGTEFDPPVMPEAMPAGAHYCDMGTVHYAQMSAEGDCKLCGMKLKKK